jgi:hypothetical protein
MRFEGGDVDVCSDGRGEYWCTYCGHRWRAGRTYLWWPVRLVWRWHRPWLWFGSHGWEVGARGIEQLVFGWALHLGPLRVLFGSEARVPSLVAGQGPGGRPLFRRAEVGR